MKHRSLAVTAACLAVFAMVSTPADARRGGSFGSRGAKTYTAPPTTRTAPDQVAPVNRTMAERPAPAAASQPGMASRQAAAPARSGGMLKGLAGGLIAGGLIGMMLGGGLGALGGSGMLLAILQAAMLAGLIWLAVRLFRRRGTAAPGMTATSARPAFAGAPGPAGTSPFTSPFAGARPADGPGHGPSGGFAPAAPAWSAAPAPVMTDLAITQADKEAFERLLGEVQDAFGNEDYARLRASTTPEVMSYLAEELSQNATRGLRNEVTGTELLEAEIAEAWSEADADYATIAMKYQSMDILRDRTTGAVVEGDPDRPTTTTELWTFVRDVRNPWRLSAIQEA